MVWHVLDYVCKNEVAMEYLTRITSFFQGLTNPHPTRDWYAMLAVATVVALVLAGVAVYFFIGIQSGFIIGTQSGAQTPAPTVSRERLMKTLDVYGERQVNFDAGGYAVPDVSDPSQ